ncbi:serine/threonine-protein kinase [Nitrospirillum amazonense]|uniref:Non-specific serine/threonine protein kinase n=1 Tax=Nitrospirillum amazonense TaxID=28077 RepID=A0A560KAZ9_9PROT|nr:serine/threonine-protein kinase [Nitrospirillum amazonense]MDG3441141.1 protein kinase [Nitrospirillum amazonense]TWB80366.1 non-specific serine/threonine protein kinase [Nitrospirillum amazonense]
MSMTAKTNWPHIEAALDQLLDLPTSSRSAALLRLAGDDAIVLAELRTLLAQAERDETWLDRPAALGPADGIAPPPFNGLSPGQRVGAYRIIGVIGRGGMGEVYRAERADGHFEQQVALKLIRRDAIDHIDRFQAERQILATLDHPAITRILDGGLHDGQPYMVMELVEGQSITAWSRDCGIGLDGRLTLFLAVCDAVAYAHRNLIVHRDLKPGNVLVTPQGQVKLLDFGIAKHIVTGDGGSPETLLAPLTPGYAAPEQLLGGPVSTATDAYALGMLLYELLAGSRPWTLEGMPLALAVRAALQEVPPPLSQFAARSDGAPPVPVKDLTGDLDAIVAKALRKEPSQRYQTVDELTRDIQRMRQGRPVSARTGSRLYVMGRFVKRHRLPMAAAGLLTLAILGGLGGVTWQYLRAQQQANRAETIKNFVLSLYSGRDPGFPKDKNRRDVTAEKLLDLGADRIGREFAGDPELELELYTLTTQLYEALDDRDRAAQIIEKKVAAAREAYGEATPIVIDAMLAQCADAWRAGDLASAQRLLDKTDVLLRAAGKSAEDIRPRWWLNKAQMLSKQEAGSAAHLAALDETLKSFERYAPDHLFHVTALQAAGLAQAQVGNFEKSAALFQQALDHFSALPATEQDNDTLITLLYNQVSVLQRTGRLDDARKNLERVSALALESQGVSAPYWMSLAQLARMLELRGSRAEAMAQFAKMLEVLPSNPPSPADYSNIARLIHAERFIVEGVAAEALPFLEEFEARLMTTGGLGATARRVHALLGQAYDQLGRAGQARGEFQKALDAYAATPANPEAQDLRGRWGWFLLDQGDPGAAGVFDGIVAEADPMATVSIAPTLAWAGRARLALASDDIAAAKAAVDQGFTAYQQIRALHDVRIHTTLLLTRSAVRLAAGDKAGARQDAALALADAQRTDAPDSPAIRQARNAVIAAGA